MRLNQNSFIKNIDIGLLVCIILISFSGLITLYSAGYDPERTRVLFTWPQVIIKSEAFFKQATFLLISVVIITCSMLIPTGFLRKWAYVLFILGVTCLLMVNFFGTVVNGSRRWLSLGFITIQPAELVKLSIIVALARYLDSNQVSTHGYGFKDLFIPLAMLSLPMFFIMKQPDLGTALSVGAIGCGMLLLVGIKSRVLVITTILVTIGIVPAWFNLHDYQRNRIIALFNPDLDPKGTGYHINQSKIAVGSGELFGKGYLSGSQAHLEFLPEHTTDFIFSVLAEERGFVGCSIVVILYLYLATRILSIVRKARNSFSALVAFGVGSIIFFHTIINIGMVLGLFPVVGIPLPLYSYGGSSLLLTMFSLGMVARISYESKVLTKDF
jgi:rod shape determining protein RodA